MKKGLLTLLSFGLLLGAFGVSSLNKDSVQASAATVQTHRRVYAYLEGGWDSSNMYIHYWGGEVGTNWSSCPQMTKVVSDYWQGLFYYDVPVDVTEFLVKSATGDVSKNSNQSDNVLISSLFTGSDYKVAAVKSWVADGTKRVVAAADNAPGNSGQIASILNHINSCSSSYAGGFNAWPQLNDLFITPSTLEGSTVVVDNFGDDTTIADKTAWLESKYNLDQGIPSGGAITYLPTKNPLLPLVLLGVVGFTALGGVYFLTKKKVSA